MKRWIIRTFFIGLLLLVVGYLSGPTTGEIRLDTGDLRYFWWGIPLRNRPMPEPSRSKLVTLGSKSPAVPADWVVCVTYPLRSSNNTDSMCQSFYRSVAILADEDP